MIHDASIIGEKVSVYQFGYQRRDKGMKTASLRVAFHSALSPLPSILSSRRVAPSPFRRVSLLLPFLLHFAVKEIHGTPVTWATTLKSLFPHNLPSCLTETHGLKTSPVFLTPSKVFPLRAVLHLSSSVNQAITDIGSLGWHRADNA